MMTFAEAKEKTDSVNEKRLEKLIGDHSMLVSNIINISAEDGMYKAAYISDNIIDEFRVILNESGYEVRDISTNIGSGVLIEWKGDIATFNRGEDILPLYIGGDAFSPYLLSEDVGEIDIRLV